ncbi:uncharacterized protein [Watersipora subatra]|uniref:uncharacterized protein n=1 Tax=Watersipora subatra TaxID=2589382 RepID=UPI00355C72D9
MGNAAPMGERLPQLSGDEPLTARGNEPSYTMKGSNKVELSDREGKEPLVPHAPPEKDLPPPACLTDGSNTAIPHEYISKWKVNNGNVEQRLKEVRYVIDFLTRKDMTELVINSKEYSKDFYLLSKGMHTLHNPEPANRKRLLETLLNEDVITFMKVYFKAIMDEFEAKKAETGNDLSNGQLWDKYAKSQPHIVDALNNCYYLLVILWNGSDMKEPKTLTALYEGAVEFVLECLDIHLYPLKDDCLAAHPQHKAIKGCLGTIHNFCNKHENAVFDLRDKDALRIIGKYRNSGTQALKTKSIFACSYLLSEDDHKNKSVIELEEKSMKFVLSVLQDALAGENEHSSKSGYHADEVILGINNIAVADSNKILLVEAGVLPLYVEAMNRQKASLQEYAAQGIWMLAFDEKNMKTIKEEPGLMQALRSLAKSKIPEVKAAADGALWKLEGEREHLQKRKANKDMPTKFNTKKLSHIMISYQWEVQEQVKKVRERLRKEGYRVWIDYERMSKCGNTLEAMARAVENAALLVPVLTEKYKASAACRQEISYAARMQKKLVPLRMQAKYRPDGWLGLLIGDTFFYDLSNPGDYESKLVGFIKAVGGDAKIKPGEPVNPVDVEEDEEDLKPQGTAVMPAQPLTSGADIDQFPSTNIKTIFNVTRLRCTSWTKERVVEWFKQHELDRYSKKFAGYDGRLLAELAALQFITPEAYYSLVKQEIGMVLIDILRLNAALRELNPAS